MGAGGSTAASCSSLDLAYGNGETGGRSHYHHYHRRYNHPPQHHLREQQMQKYRAKSKVPPNDLLKSPGYNLKQSTSYFDLTTSHLLDDRRDCNNNNNNNHSNTHLSPTKLTNNWHPISAEAAGAHLEEAYSLSNANIGASQPVMVLPCKPVSPALHLKKTNAGVASRILHQRQQQRYNELKKFSDSLPSLNNVLDPSTLHQSVPHQSHRHHHHHHQHPLTSNQTNIIDRDNHPSSRLLSPTRHHHVFTSNNSSKNSPPIHHHRDQQLSVTQAVSSGAKPHQLHNYNLVRNNNNSDNAPHHDKHISHNQTAWQRAVASPINCKSDYLAMKRATSMSSLHNLNQSHHYNNQHHPDACSRAGQLLANHRKDAGAKHTHLVSNTKRYAPLRPESLNSSSRSSVSGNHCSSQFASRNHCKKLQQPARQSASPCNVRHQRSSPPSNQHYNHHNHQHSSHNPPPPPPAAAMVKNVLKYRQQVSQGVQASKQQNRYKSKQQAQQQQHQVQQGCPVLPPLPRSQSLHELIQLRATENGQRMRTTGTLRGPLSGAEQGNKVNLVAELLETRRQKKQQQDMDNNAAGQAEQGSATMLSQSSSTDDGIHDISITADNNSTSDSSPTRGQLESSANRKTGAGTTGRDPDQMQSSLSSPTPTQSSRHGGLLRQQQQQPAMSPSKADSSRSKQRHSQNVPNGNGQLCSRSEEQDPLKCNGSTTADDHQSKSTLRRSQSHSALHQGLNCRPSGGGEQADGDESDDLDELARFVYQFKQLNANKRASASASPGGGATANKGSVGGANLGQQDSPNLQQSPNSTTSSSGFASSTCTSQSASSTSDGGLESLVNRHQRLQHPAGCNRQATSSDPKRAGCSPSADNNKKKKKYQAPAPPATGVDNLAVNNSGKPGGQLECPISGKLKLSSSLLSIVDEYQSSLQSRHHQQNSDGSRLEPALLATRDAANLTPIPSVGGGEAFKGSTGGNLHNNHHHHHHQQHSQLEQLRRYTQLRQKSQSELALNHLTSTVLDPAANLAHRHQLARQQSTANPSSSKVNLTAGLARDEPESNRGNKPYKSRLINLIRRISDRSEAMANGSGSGGVHNASGRSSSSAAGRAGQTGGCGSESGSSVGGHSHHQIFRNSSGACQLVAGGKAATSSAGSKQSTAINQNAPVPGPSVGYSDQTPTSGLAGCELLHHQQASFAKTESDLAKRLQPHAGGSSNKSNEIANRAEGQASESYCDLNFDCDFELVKNCGSTSATTATTTTASEHNNGNSREAIKRAHQASPKTDSANGPSAAAAATAPVQPACDQIPATSSMVAATNGSSMLDLVGQCNRPKLGGKKLAKSRKQLAAIGGCKLAASSSASVSDGIRDNWRLAAPIASPCLVANASCANIPAQTSFESPSGKGHSRLCANDNKHNKAAKHQQNKSAAVAAAPAIGCGDGDVDCKRQTDEKSSQPHCLGNKATGRQQSPGLTKMKWSASSWLLSATGSGAKKSKLHKEQQQQQQQQQKGALGKSRSYLDRLLPSSGTSQSKGSGQNDLQNIAPTTTTTTESEADQLLDELDQSLELVSGNGGGRYGAFTPVVSWWRQGAKNDAGPRSNRHQHLDYDDNDDDDDDDELMQREKNIRLNALLSDSDEDDNDDADYASINQAMINETFDVNFAKSDEYLLSSKLSIGQPGSPSHSFTFSSPNTPIQSSPQAADAVPATVPANNDPNDFANQQQGSEGGPNSASGPRQSNTAATNTNNQHHHHRTGLQANEFPSSPAKAAASAMQQVNMSKACSSSSNSTSNNNSNGPSDNDQQIVGAVETGRVVASSAGSPSERRRPSSSNVNNSTFTRISQARQGCDVRDTTSKIASICNGQDLACKSGRGEPEDFQHEGGNRAHGDGDDDDSTLLTEGRRQASTSEHLRTINDTINVQGRQAKGAFSVHVNGNAVQSVGGGQQSNPRTERDRAVSDGDGRLTSGQSGPASRCLKSSPITGVKGNETGGHDARAASGCNPDDRRRQAGAKSRQIQGRSPCCSRRAHCCCDEGEVLETPGSFKQQQFDASPCSSNNNSNHPDELQVNLANESAGASGCRRCHNDNNIDNMEVDSREQRLRNKSHLQQPTRDHQLPTAAAEALLQSALSGRRKQPPSSQQSYCHDGVESPARQRNNNACSGGCCCNVNSADNSHVDGNGGCGGSTTGVEQEDCCWKRKRNIREDNGDKVIVACGLACNGQRRESGEPTNKLIDCRADCPCALVGGAREPHEFAAGVAGNSSRAKPTEEPIKCAPVASVAAAAAAAVVSDSQAPEKKYPIGARGSRDNGNNVLVASSSSSSSSPSSSSAAPPTVVSSSRADEDNCFPAASKAAISAPGSGGSGSGSSIAVGYYHYSHEKGKFAPTSMQSSHVVVVPAAAADVGRAADFMEGCSSSANKLKPGAARLQRQATNHISGCANFEACNGCGLASETAEASSKHVKCPNHKASNQMIICDHLMANAQDTTKGQRAGIPSANLGCCATSASASSHPHNCCMNNRNVRCENPGNEMMHSSAMDANYPAGDAKMLAACHHKHPSSDARLLENNNNSNNCLDRDVKEPTPASSSRPSTAVNLAGCNLVHGICPPSGPTSGGVHKEGNCCECHSSANDNNDDVVVGAFVSSINTVQSGAGHQRHQIANLNNCHSSASSAAAAAAACVNLSRYNPIKLTNEVNGKHHHDGVVNIGDGNERVAKQAAAQRHQQGSSSSSANQKHLGREPLALFGRLRNSLLSGQKSGQTQSPRQSAGHRLSAAQSQLSLLDYCNSANAPAYLKANLMDINPSKQLDIFDDNFILKRKTPNAGLKSRC